MDTLHDALEQPMALLTVHACCPHCDSDLTVIGDRPVTSDEGYDNGHNKGRGAYKVACESCGKRFHVEAEDVYALQHVALILLGEAE